MTTATSSATKHVSASSPTGTIPVDSRNTYQLRFGGVIRSEWIKLLSLRSMKITLAVTVLASLGIGALIGWASKDFFTEQGDAALNMYLLQVATFPATFLALIFGVLGVFAVASEYSSGMILSTLAAVPTRRPVFWAKAIVLTIVAGVTALFLVLAGLGIGALMVPDAAAGLIDPQVVSGSLGTVAYLVLIALFAFGVASLLRSTAGGIAVVAGITFVLPVGFQVLMMTGWEWVTNVASYLPSSLGSTLGQGIDEGVVATVDGMGGEPTGPTFWVALAAMAVWAAVTVLPAAGVFQRRDAH